MIKALENSKKNPKLSVLGYITTGEAEVKEEGGRAIPKQVDHFVLPENLQEYFKKAGLSTEPTLIENVFFTSDNPDIAFKTGYEQWGGGKRLLCYGDDVRGTAIRQKYENNKVIEKAEVVCAGEDCEFRENDKCKPTGKLYAIIPSYPQAGAWVVQTRGWGSLHAITNSLWSIYNQTGGRLVGIPFNLHVEDFMTPNGKRWKVVPKPAISFEEIMSLVRKDRAVAALEGTTAISLEVEDDKETVVEETQEAEIVNETPNAVASNEPDNPFAAFPDAEIVERITPEEADEIDTLRKGVISDSTWKNVMKSFCKVDKTKNLPKEFTRDDNVIQTYDYFKRVITKAAESKKPAKEEAVVEETKKKCTSCDELFDAAEITTVDGEDYCPSCKKFLDDVQTIT